MTLKELQEKRERLVAAARSRLDEINANTDEARTAELEQQHDAAMAELDTLDTHIERSLRVEEAEGRAAEMAERAARSRRPNEDGEGGSEPEAVTYRQAFNEYILNQGQVSLMAPEARAVLQRGYQQVETEERAQTTSATAGGYTVPEEMLAELIKSLAAWGPMYDPGITREIVTSSGNIIKIPTVNDIGRVIQDHTEGASLTDDGGSDVVFGQKQLEAYAYNTEWLRVSIELASDSMFGMETVLTDLLGDGLGRKANTALTTGSGSSAPHGIVTASSLGKTAAAVAAITGDEILDLEHSVDPAYRQSPRAMFMFNDSTLLALRKLKDGQGNYLWTAGNVQSGVPGTINGRRYVVNQAMASLATGQKTIIFGDMSKYFVRKVGSPIIGAMQDKDFWPGFGVAGFMRFDGELVDTAAIKHLIMA